MIIPLNLSGVWLTTVDGTSLQLQHESPLPDDDQSVTVSVQDYAGRRRIVSTAQRQATVALQLVNVTPDQLAQLVSWQGTLLLLRTLYWRRWGMFASVTSTPLAQHEWLDGQAYRVKLPWTDVDYSEAI